MVRGVKVLFLAGNHAVVRHWRIRYGEARQDNNRGKEGPLHSFREILIIKYINSYTFYKTCLI